MSDIITHTNWVVEILLSVSRMQSRRVRPMSPAHMLSLTVRRPRIHHQVLEELINSPSFATVFD